MERELKTARLLTYRDNVDDCMGTGQPVWHDMHALVAREAGTDQPWRVLRQSNRIIGLMDDAIDLAAKHVVFEYGVVMAHTKEA